MTKKYNIGDVIKTIDGVGYTGDSLTYQPGWISEIIGIKESKKYGFEYKLRSGDPAIVIQSEIEKIILTNYQRIRKFGKLLKELSNNAYLVEESGEIEKVKIIDYDYSQEKYIIKTKSFVGTPYDNTRLFINKLSAYEHGYKILINKFKKIEQLF